MLFRTLLGYSDSNNEDPGLVTISIIFKLRHFFFTLLLITSSSFNQLYVSFDCTFSFALCEREVHPAMATGATDERSDAPARPPMRIFHLGHMKARRHSHHEDICQDSVVVPPRHNFTFDKSQEGHYSIPTTTITSAGH